MAPARWAGQAQAPTAAALVLSCLWLTTGTCWLATLTPSHGRSSGRLQIADAAVVAIRLLNQTTEKEKFLPWLRWNLSRTFPLSYALLSHVFIVGSRSVSLSQSLSASARCLVEPRCYHRLGCASRDSSVADGSGTATRRRLGLDFRATNWARRGYQSTGFKSASAPPRVLAGFARSGARTCRHSAMQQQGKAESHGASLQSCNLSMLLSVLRVRFSGKRTHVGGRGRRGDCARLPGSASFDPQMQLVNH